jgi:uncharacterized FlgJ-related protein
MTLDQKIYNIAIANGIPDTLAQLIVAQAKHETANYTSNVFKSCNNLFGYKYVGQSLATQCNLSPELDYYARYATIDDSVLEIVKWIKRRVADGKFPSDLATIQTADQYATLLKNAGYYTGTLAAYKNGLSFFLASLTNLATNKYTGLLILGLIGLGMLYRGKFFS